MRTTLDIDNDLLEAAKELTRQEGTSAGEVVSRLLRQSLTGRQTPKPSTRAPAKAVAGFIPFPAKPGIVVTDAQVNALGDAESV